MTDSADQDQVLVALLAREAADRAGESPASAEPEPEELLDFLRGGLSTKEEEDLQERILAEPKASRSLLDLEALVRDGEKAAAETTADLAAAAGWRELQGRLPSSAQESSPGTAGRDSRSSGPVVAARRSPFWLQPVAAALFLATVGLSILLLQRPLVPSLTVANLQTLELAAGQRSAGEPVEVTVAAEDPFSLILDPAERCPTYRLTITGAGAPLPLEELERDPRGALVILLQLSPGTYTATLEGCAASKELERYEFRVTRAP